MVTCEEIREEDVQCPNCKGYKEIPHYKEWSGRITEGQMCHDGRSGQLRGEYTHSTICGRCNGAGRIKVGEILDKDECPNCSNGKVPYNPWYHPWVDEETKYGTLISCPRCKGIGKLKPAIRRTKSL